VVEDTPAEALSPKLMTERTKAYHDMLDLLVFRFFQKGLREEIRSSLRNALPSTLDEAIAIAERYEDEILIQDDFRRLNVTVAEHSVDPTVQRAEAQLKALNDNGKGSAERTEADRAPLRDIRCYNCNKTGHYARNCNSLGIRYRERRLTGHRRFMDRDESTQMRRQMQSMPRKAVAQQRSYEDTDGKFSRDRQSQRSARKGGPPTEGRREDPRRKDHKRRAPSEEGHSTWLQDNQSKNGMRPPRRGGSQQLPRPFRPRK
jgi:hypothetical protein